MSPSHYLLFETNETLANDGEELYNPKLGINCYYLQEPLQYFIGDTYKYEVYLWYPDLKKQYPLELTSIYCIHFTPWCDHAVVQ